MTGAGGISRVVLPIGVNAVESVSGVVERRTRPDGVYEWYASADAPLDVSALAAS